VFKATISSCADCWPEQSQFSTPRKSKSKLVPDESQYRRDENDQHRDFENDEFDLNETITELGQLVFRLAAGWHQIAPTPKVWESVSNVPPQNDPRTRFLRPVFCLA
jgi:hypothetical protein